MNGRITSCRRCTSFALMLRSPSTIWFSGFENQKANSPRLRNSAGIRKCISDHSSISEFCSGVPVSSSRRLVLKCSSTCQRSDWKFLMLCASSSTMYTHFFRRNTAASFTTSWYDVMHTWKELGDPHPFRFSYPSAPLTAPTCRSFAEP